MARLSHAAKPIPAAKAIDPLAAIVRRMPSDQIAAVMEFYSSRILDMLCTYSTGGLDLAAECLSIVVKKRRKITPVAPEKAANLLFYSMLYQQHLTAALRALQIEQSIILAAVEPALKKMDDQPARHLELLCQGLESFRSLVTRRYGPLARKSALTMVWARSRSGHIIEPDDATQNFESAVVRAIDKFDPNSGTLTSYTVQWLRNAQNSDFSIHLGTSFSMPRSARAKIARGATVHGNNHSVDLEAVMHTAAEGLRSEESLALADRAEHTNFGPFLDAMAAQGRFEEPQLSLALAVLQPYMKPTATHVGL